MATLNKNSLNNSTTNDTNKSSNARTWTQVYRKRNRSSPEENIKIIKIIKIKKKHI